MENIAAARPDMAVLDQNKLMLSPFGALSHALAEEILARTGQAEGVYPFVPLELLTEPEQGPEEKKEEPAVNVEVKLTLELTKEARELRERTETVERILERIERIRERGEASQKPQGRERDAAPSGESRSFFQNINQHISFPMTLSVPENSGTAQPGGIARISEKFANTLKTMRDEGIYSEPGGETRRIADAGREGARIAGEQAAGSGAVSGGEASRIAGRTAVSGKQETSNADFIMRAAETELNTSGMPGANVESPELTARAAERIAKSIGESAAREIADKLSGLAKSEAQAESRAVTGGDGDTGTAARNIDNDRGQSAREDIEAVRPSMTRRQEARSRDNPEAAESAKGEVSSATRAGTDGRTAEVTAERAAEVAAVSGDTSPEGRREAAGPEREERPSRAVPIRSEDRPLTPEELALAAGGAAAASERSGEETIKAGREAAEDDRSHRGREVPAEREDKRGAAPRRAGRNRAQGRANEDTATIAGETGTAEKAEGRAVAGEIEKPGISQNAGKEGPAARPAYGPEGKSPEDETRTVIAHEEPTTAELSYRDRSVDVPEGVAGKARGGHDTEAEAIPLRGQTKASTPEELTLAQTAAAERSGDVSSTAGRHADGDRTRAADRAKSTDDKESPDKRSAAQKSEAADVDTTAGETQPGAAGRTGHRAGGAESAIEVEDAQGATGSRTDGETAPATKTGRSAEASPGGESVSGEILSSGERTGRGERPEAAIPDRVPTAPERPEELIHRETEGILPEGVSGTRISGAAHNVGETRDAGRAHNAGEARGNGAARNAGEARDAGEGRKAGETRGVGETRETGDTRDTEKARNAGKARSVGETRNVGKGRDAGETRNTGETRGVGETRETREAGEIRGVGETHKTGDTGKAHNVSEAYDAAEARDNGESYDTDTAYDTGAAEAIPLRGDFGRIAPEELALASADAAARPGGEIAPDAVRGETADVKHDTHPHSWETVHIDGKTGRPGNAPAAPTGEDGARTGRTGRAAENTGRTGEVRPVEEAATRAGTAGETATKAMTAEAGQTERPAGAIRGQGMPMTPAPEELVHQMGTATPEAGAALSPGSAAKSVEAFAESIAEKVRRAEDRGLGVGGVSRGLTGAARQRPETAAARREGAAGAGTVSFPPPVELTGATGPARDAGGVGFESPARFERASAGSEGAMALGLRAEEHIVGREYGDTPLTLASDNTDSADLATGRQVQRAPRPAERSAGGNAISGPAPVELAYGSTGESRPEGQSRTQQAGDIAESEYVKSLPDWARRFLKEGAGSLGTAGNMAVTAPVTAQNKKPQMVEWTAPGFHQTPPAETQYRELKPPEDMGGQTGEVRISDAEIRCTADRVYKIIEDRIRRERRRLGL